MIGINNRIMHCAVRTILSLVFVVIGFVGAAHLHKDVSSIEDHEYYRQLREIHHPTNHSFINPAFCHGNTTKEECQQLEDHMLDNARNLRGIIQTEGRLRVLVLCIQWSNHDGRELPDTKTLDQIFNGNNKNDIIPTGSIKQWMHANSHGNLQFVSDQLFMLRSLEISCFALWRERIFYSHLTLGPLK